MRIGMLVDTYKPHVSGITNYIELNKRELERTGHEVYVFTFGRPGQTDDESHILRSRGLPLGATGYYVALRHSSEAQTVLRTMDVAQVHHPFLSGQLALRYCRPAGIPVVFTNHTRYDLYADTYLPFMPRTFSRGFLRWYMPALCSAVDLVVSPSAGMVQVLRDLGVTAPIELVPNGVDVHRFQAAVPLERRSLGLSEEDVLLVYAGRVAREKNMEFLLRAYDRVAQDVSNVHLLIIGGGQTQILEDLKAFSARLGLSQRVTFTGMIPYANLPSYLAMCDAFVSASVSEVHPLSVIEAMSAGLPVLGIHSPGVGDTVADGQTGFLTDHDLGAYAARMKQLSTDPELLKRMGQAARLASEAYAIERTTSRMLEQYERLVAAARSKRQDRAVLASSR